MCGYTVAMATLTVVDTQLKFTPHPFPHLTLRRLIEFFVFFSWRQNYELAISSLNYADRIWSSADK